MALTLDSIIPEAINRDGGHLIRIIGDFSDHQGKEFQIHVGPVGDATDPLAFSGIPGRPTTVFPLNDTEIRCFSPVLTNSTWKVFVIRLDASESASKAAVSKTYVKGFETSVYDLRRVLPPYYLVGPRSIEQEEPV